MKVFIHTDEYSPTAQACTNRMRSFADALISKGEEVTVICSSANLENGNPKIGQEKVIYAQAYRMKRKTTVQRMLNNMSFAVSSILCAMKAGEADVVITTSPPPLISLSGWAIARLKKAKLVYDVRDIWPDVAVEMGSFSEKSIYYRLFKAITQFMYDHADMITTVSPGKLDKIKCKIKKKPGVSSETEKIFLAANGFDENVETYPIKSDVAAQYGMDRTFTCVYIGNIGLAQGLESLLQLAVETKHRNVRFLLFGKGAEKERLEKMAQEKGLKNVAFCGVLPAENVHSVLSFAGISFISLKSSKMKDSIPTKLYEALGIGCPVLLLAEGDSCDLLDATGLGRHVSPDHLEHLAAVFDDMVDHYQEIVSLKEAARELIHKKYTRQQIGIALAGQLRNLTACE